MLPWIVPTEAHILSRVSAVELEAFRSVALAAGQADPVTAQIGIVVAFMRGYIARCANVKMSSKPAGSIPESGLHAFLDIIVPTIQQRPAGAVIEGTNGIRLDARSDAMKWLADAAACKIAVDEEPPSTAPEAPSPPPRYKRRDRSNTDGI